LDWWHGLQLAALSRTNDPAQSVLQRRPPPTHEIPQSQIDEALVVASTSHLDPDRDTSLAMVTHFPSPYASSRNVGETDSMLAGITRRFARIHHDAGQSTALILRIER
jgi:hypothetical protein